MPRRILPVLLVFGWLLFAKAYGQMVTLGAGSATGSPGSTVSVSISLAGSGLQPAAVQWTLGYSTADVANITWTVGPAGAAADKQVQCSGGTCVLYGLNANTIPDGIVAVALIQISPATPDTSFPVQVFEVAASTGDANAIPASGNDGLININPQLVGPSLTCPASGASTGVVGFPFGSGNLKVTGGNPPYNFLAVGTLPTGLTLNTSTGAITGTALTAGSFTIQVNDANGMVAATSCPYTTTSAWYDSSWTNRKAIAIDHTKVSGADLSNFPMLFSVTDPDLRTVANGGSVGKADGTDILFTASDGVTKLDHELEFYKASTGQVIAWVRLPLLSASADTVVSVYYGNAAAVDQQNKTGVWDSNYNLVWHLGDGTTLNGADSTSNGNNGIAYGLAAAGKIGGGAGGAVQGLSGTLPAGDQTRTLECWFKITGNSGSDQALCGMGYDSGTGTIFLLMYRAAGSTLSLDAVGMAQSFPWTYDTNWHHLAATYTSGSGLQNAALYLDGIQQATTGGSGTLATQAYTYVDVLHSPAYPLSDMTGVIDEFRISNAARLAGWIATEYNNQNSAANFFSVGNQESGNSSQVATPTFTLPGGSYVGPQSVTISTTTAGASIHYTTDGSTPSSTSGTLYSGLVSVSGSETLQAIASLAGMTDSAVASAAYTIQAPVQVATLAFAPPTGDYSSAQSVTISTTTPGASIHYTTDGSTPSSTVGIAYSGPVLVSSNQMLKAIAYESGFADSAVASASYTIQVATPTFAPPAGNYGSAQSVTMSTTTAGASIRYTTDGSTLSSIVGIVYSGPVSVSSSQTLKAIAYRAGMTDSTVATASYVITPGAGNAAVFVKTDVATMGTWKGAYGADGYNVFDDTVSYPGYVTVTPAGQANWVWAGSTSDGRGLQKALSSTDRIAATWYTSTSYTIDLNFNDGAQHQLAVYCLDWDSGGRTQTVSILDGATNAVLDSQNIGNFQNGKYLVWKLTGHVILRVTNAGGLNATISGLFFDPSGSGSALAPVATPTFEPPPGAYTSAQSVTISTTTTGASIHYTTDGSTPSSTSGTLYSGPVSVSGSETLQAIASLAGMTDSAVASAAYMIQAPVQVATPMFAPPAGNYSSTQSVTISTTTAGASIHYTTDGSTPSSTVGIAYSGPVLVSSNQMLKAIAYESGFADSAVASASYTIQVTTPTFGLPAGNYSSAQSVAISTVTAGASIHYTTDGSTPSSTVGILYSGPISVSSSMTLKAVAYMAGMADSAVGSATYAVQAATPTFNPPSGSYGSAQSVTIGTTTAGASIHYTTDGSTPSSTVGIAYSGPVSVSSNMTLNAVAYGSGLTTSAVGSAAYTIQVATPTFAPPAGNYSSTQSVTISTPTAGASIHYTTDGSTPSSTVGIVYSGPVSVSSSQTLKAIAYETGMTDSTVATASYVMTPAVGNAAVFVKTDVATMGTWKGAYGADGYNVFDDTVSYPGYVTATPAGQVNWVWASSTSDVRGLQKALSSADRIAAAWYTSTSYTIDLNFNDGAQHQLAVYCLDWDSSGRAQTVSILDGATNAVLDSQNIGNFQNGKYLVWKLTGHVILQVTNTGGGNAVISGLFFDPSGSGSIGATQTSTPTFNPPPGAYGSAQMVTISTTTAGASIYYTTDGSTPSNAGTVYAGPVPVSSGLTLKAIAYEGGTASAVASASYTIQAATPAFTPPGGSYSGRQSVTIGTTTAGASIRYTTDGSTPSSTVGTVYSGPVSVSSNLTLNAVAYGSGLTASPVATASYTIASGWYDPSWTNRKAITVDHTKVSGGDLGNFPILFSVTDLNLRTVANGGSVGKADGTDILFTASDGVTKLDHELESYNASTGQVIAWVRLPLLSASTDTAIYVYYGNASAADQQNKTGVWDGNYKLVWHLGNGTTLSGADSTSNGNSGISYGLAAAGKIGGGAGGDVEGLSGTLPGGDQTRTVECWFQITGNSGSDQVLCGMGYNSGTGTIFSLMYRAAGSTLSLDAMGIAQSFSWTYDNNWHHLAASYTSGSGLQNAVLYLDGIQQTTTGGTGTLATQFYTYVDVRHSPAYSLSDMTGVVDEFRISNSVRSAGWITTGYDNQNSPSTFFSVGIQE
jgi:hypothetical protein